MKIRNITVPKFLSLEHVILEVIASASRQKHTAVSTQKIILYINNHDFKKVVGVKKNFSSGAIYGTLSRLKGKQWLRKVMIIENEKEILAYQLTDSGHEVLCNIKNTAKTAIKGLENFVPILG